ncbi:GAF and ANTAR domain-containing protein [Nocardioides anomalus]|uniref:GAF and ANTAR domain-containing protein n=1 Tax=Nocardioides anomalus TaxID=2712223 RepID=A0A6G6W960_9ACTN|nr:GAF and ANTAR domain-containing protein [Nocardioides anomalus]QIG41693.1 GAF and ANTAR domain-containing protein [Nocardioides anomalus]
MSVDGFSQRVASAVRELQAQHGQQDTMVRAVGLAVDLVPGCDFAAVTEVRARGVGVLAASDERLEALVALQHELEEGPCLTAAETRDAVVSDEVATDPRWPAWGDRAHGGLGLRSVMSQPLFTTGGNLGVLNLYSVSGAAFAPEHVFEDGSTLAAHVSVALAAARNAEQLEVAIASRTVIGQATGIIMERYDLAPDLAFGVLARLSQQTERKVRDLADELVRTRVLPQH